MQKELSIERVKEIQLEMLGNFHRFCQEKGLTYFMAFGSLIGAVRHEGYIPWDDDIDVYMPLEDYEKLLEEGLFYNRYYVQTPYENREYGVKHYFAPYAKLFDLNTILIQNPQEEKVPYHIYLDVYPLFKVPNDELERKTYMGKLWKYAHKHYLLNKSYYSFRGARNRGRKLKAVVIYTISKFIPQYKYISKMRQLMHKFDNTDVDKCATVCIGKHCVNISYNLNAFSKVIPQPFEDITCWIPIGYDGVLKSEFGDYMKLPKESEQVAHHDFIAYCEEK